MIKYPLLTIVTLCAFMGTTFGTESLRILMIGNSYTHSGSTWEQTWRNLEGFLDADPDYEATIVLRTPGGKQLLQHWNDGTGTNTARWHIVDNGPWDYVFLQEQSQLAGFYSRYNVADFSNAIDSFIPLIRAQSAKTVLFSTWGREDANGIQSFSNSTANHLDHTSYAYAAKAHQWSVKAAPCGEAFEFAEGQITNLALRRSDGSHQNAKGAYLAAAAMYHTITGKDPKAVDFNGGNSQADADALCDAFNQMISNFAANTSLPLLSTFNDGSHPVPFYPNPDPTLRFTGDPTPTDKTYSVTFSTADQPGTNLASVQSTLFTPIASPFNNNSSWAGISSTATPTSVSYRFVSGNSDNTFTVDASGNITLNQTPTEAFPRTLRVRVTDSNQWCDDGILTIHQSPDADADNLNDAWEVFHFGSYHTQSSTHDLDGDGNNHFKEMAFGSNPKVIDNGSSIRIGNLVENGSKLEFLCRRPKNYTNLGLTYQLQSSDDMTTDPWGDDPTPPFSVHDDPDGTNEWVTYRIPAPASGNKFYRYHASHN